MNIDAAVSALIGAIPGFLASLMMLRLTRQSNQTLERVKTDLQRDVVQFTKWHEKRIEALIIIYGAFCDYMDFLRRALYLERSEGVNLDPMWDFRKTIERQILYLDDAMAKKITEYQGELLMFWNDAVTSLTSDDKKSREKVQRQLDYEIPAYLPKLQDDINRSLDPDYAKSDDPTFRRMIAELLAKHTHEKV